MTTPRKTDPARPAKADDKMTFEKALERLEAIVNEMESGSLSLDKMIARFEEGQGLIKFCSGKLNEVEKKIEVLVKKGDELATEPFTAPDDNGPENDESDEETGKKDKDELF